LEQNVKVLIQKRDMLVLKERNIGTQRKRMVGSAGVGACQMQFKRVVVLVMELRKTAY
jgi:ADP-dependent phosphofructokinase/glucokinase